ncbi:MAG TPA: hypothetical protein VH540_07920 [Ktedonobacterales bacterium]|jgi:hypothetical protein
MQRQEDDLSSEPFEVEISALSEAENEQEGNPPVQRLPRLRRLSPKARAWRLALAGGAVILAALALVLSLYPNALLQLFTTPKHLPLELHPQQEGLTCLDDAAWAPQGEQIALLGFHGPCENTGGYYPGLVLIYNAETGAVVARLQPDDAILAALQDSRARRGQTARATSMRLQFSRIDYQHVLWSPDGLSPNGGKRLALTFNVWLSSSSSTRLDGVALLDLRGVQEQVFYQPVPVVGPVFQEWDIEQGVTLGVTPGPLAFGPLFEATAPLAMTFHWGGAGALQFQMFTGMKDSVGNPDGGEMFSPWQPGIIHVAEAASNLGPFAPTTLDTWNTRFAAWSPDGRYLFEGLALVGRLVDARVPDASIEALFALHAEGFPTLPVRDAGLSSVLQGIAPGNPENVAVAWRPDGKVLAAVPVKAQAGQKLTLVSTTDGQKQATFTFPKSTLPYLTSTPVLRWSPDGTRLLGVDTQVGVVMIWQAGQAS